MFIFVKEGIRKLSDLNTVRGNNTKFILIRWHLVARMNSVSQNMGHRQDRKESSATLSSKMCGTLWQYLSRYCAMSKTKPTVGVLHSRMCGL